jgi:hypothetical protein
VLNGVVISEDTITAIDGDIIMAGQNWEFVNKWTCYEYLGMYDEDNNLVNTNLYLEFRIFGDSVLVHH